MLLLSLFIVAVLVNTCFYIAFSRFIYTLPQPLRESSGFPVSVIVCAKNEAENLEKNIPLLLEQEYPNFELILVNDASTDETPNIIEKFAEQDARVHTVHIQNNEAFWSNKKYSLTLGIKRAIHNRLLFTDADCQPASKYWIQHMVQSFSEEKQLILGYGGYTKTKGLLNKLIRFETLMTAIQYFSFAKMGSAYMGVGRNLTYTSDLFYKNRGFMSHMNIRSGDDDLFVNEAATKKNVALCHHPDGFTYSAPKKTWSEWWHQKKRHITTAKYYKVKHKTLLALYYLSTLLFWILAILCFVFIDWKIPLALVIFKFFLHYLFVGKGAKHFKEPDLKPWLPFLELLLVLAQLTIFISNSVAKPTRWK